MTVKLTARILFVVAVFLGTGMYFLSNSLNTEESLPDPVQIFEEDGVILFSAEHLVPGATQQTTFSNLALHEYARIFAKTNPHLPYPKLDTSIPGKLVIISGFENEKVREYIGLPQLDPFLLRMPYFFPFPAKYKQILPEVFADQK